MRVATSTNMKYDKKTKTMDYSNKELGHVHGGSFGKKAKAEALKKKTSKRSPQYHTVYENHNFEPNVKGDTHTNCRTCHKPYEGGYKN